jgi:hypothetical protein
MFLDEIKRVLKIHGVLRIVVPDLEAIAKTYLDHILMCERDQSEIKNHDAIIADIIEQSVRKESFGTKQKTPIRRFLENQFLGDARKRGETHQWMYDRMNLSELLRGSGFKNIMLQDFDTSTVQRWQEFKLDQDENGYEYKPNSLYMEAIK